MDLSFVVLYITIQMMVKYFFVSLEHKIRENVTQQPEIYLGSSIGSAEKTQLVSLEKEMLYDMNS